MSLTAKQKTLLRWLGYPLLAVVVFVFAVFYTFPYERVGTLLEDLGRKNKWDLSIQSISPGLLPGRINLSGIEVKTIPTKPEETPMTFWVDEVSLKVGLISYVFGGLNVDVDAVIGDGVVEAEIKKNGSRIAIELETEALPLQTVPGLRYALGDLPTKGALDADFDLTLPSVEKNGKEFYSWKEAEGQLTLSCFGCEVGDGKAKIKLRPRPGRRLVYKEGITVPRLQVGEVNADITIVDGVGTINEFKARGIDGELDVDGEIRFEDPVGNTEFPACFRFKLSDALKGREEKFGSVETMLTQAKQANGTYAVPTKGKLSNFKFNTKAQCSEKGAGPAVKPPTTLKPSSPLGNDQGNDDFDTTDKPDLPLIPTGIDSVPAIVRPEQTDVIPIERPEGPEDRPELPPDFRDGPRRPDEFRDNPGPDTGLPDLRDVDRDVDQQIDEAPNDIDDIVDEESGDGDFRDGPQSDRRGQDDEGDFVVD